MTSSTYPTAAAGSPEIPGDGAREENRLILAGLVVIGVTFGGFGVWAATAPVSGAVIVLGTVNIESERKTVQHLEGGIVREILVKPGSVVGLGQPLIRLADVQADASATALRKQLDADLARVARLEAERSGAAAMRLPPELEARASLPAVAPLIEPERKLFETRRRVLDEQVALLRAESVQVREEQRSLQGRLKSIEQAMAAIREQLAMSESLRQGNFVSQARVLELRAQLADAESKHGESSALLAQAGQKITQNELRAASLRQTYMKEATDELRDAERRVAELRERLRPTEDLLARQTIVAPIGGEVVNLRVHTVGGVIAPREPLMEVVPTNSPLVVKGKVRTEDITHVRVGAEVAVQLTAYKRRTTPVVNGKLAYVSADTLTENTPAGPATYYEVRIVVDKAELEAAGNLEISPGMPVEAFIRTEDRTLVEYMVQPVVQAMRRGFREY